MQFAQLIRSLNYHQSGLSQKYMNFYGSFIDLAIICFQVFQS